MKFKLFILFALIFSLNASIEQRSLSFSKFDFFTDLTSTYTDVFQINLTPFDDLQPGLVKLTLYSIDSASVNVRVLVDDMVIIDKQAITTEQVVGFKLPSNCNGRAFRLQIAANSGHISYALFQITSGLVSTLATLNYTPQLKITYIDVFTAILGPNEENVLGTVTVSNFDNLDGVNVQILVDGTVIAFKKPMYTSESLQFHTPFVSNGKLFQLQMSTADRKKLGKCLFQIKTY